MKIIVGLGNPGAKYLLTRHNLGFMLIDALSGEGRFQNKYKSQIKKSEWEGKSVLLVKPQTFMNLSGMAVREIVSFYKVPLENLLVIHDDKDLPFGKMKFQKSRGDGGHNGVVSVHQELNSQDYCRLKMGVAPASTNKKLEEIPEKSSRETILWPHKHIRDGILTSDMDDSNLRPDTAQFVLSPFNPEEQIQLSRFLEQGVKAVHHFVKQGYEKSANQFNSKELNV